MKLIDILSGNLTRTENDALTYVTTGDAVLDFFYHAAPKRGKNDEVVSLFARAYNENPLLSLQALFYLRDVRGSGQGERSSFRIILSWLADNDPIAFFAIISAVPEYGRWDDIIPFISYPGVNISETVIGYVERQLNADIAAYVKNQPISLLAKWLPSENTSSKATCALAKVLRKQLGYSAKEYRRTLSELRKYLRVVERDMSANNWSNVDYSAIPSKAALIYRNAFKKHDGERYSSFLNAVLSGKAKINSSTLYPYDLVKPYLSERYWDRLNESDATIEAQWMNLPNFSDTDGNAIVVADVSGSMFTSDRVRPIDIAVSLALYIAERNTGPYKDKFINFSTKPHFVTLKGDTLYDRINSIDMTDWAGSTNIQGVFDLILNAALAANLPTNQMVKRIFIISDMEFNQSITGMTNYDEMKYRFELAGYDIPMIVFWNVASRHLQTPVTKDENGTMLVSGASGKIFESVMKSSALTPLDLMYDVLYSDRYNMLAEHIIKYLDNFR
jgi:hypothetical protein